jgi:hypothetical protein
MSCVRFSYQFRSKQRMNVLVNVILAVQMLTAWA